MSILKLPNAGDSATLEITGCEEIEGQYGQQIAFTCGSDILYLPKASADRQLERIGLGFEEASYAEIVGKILTFSRTPNPKAGSKPFWDISLAGNGKPPVAKKEAPAHASKPNAELPPLLQHQAAEDAAELKAKVGDGREEVVRALKYKHADALKQAVEYTLKIIEPLYRAKEIGLTGDESYKHAYTIFQTWEDRGLIE